MDYQSSISTTNIDLQELEALVDTLEKMTGQKLTIDTQFVVHCEDAVISDTLDNLFSSLADLPVVVRKTSKSKPQKKARSQKPAGEMGPRSLKNVETGEIISKVAVARGLAEGKILPGTQFEDHNGMRYAVVGEELIKEPQP